MTDLIIVFSLGFAIGWFARPHFRRRSHGGMIRLYYPGRR